MDAEGRSIQVGAMHAEMSKQHAAGPVVMYMCVSARVHVRFVHVIA